MRLATRRSPLALEQARTAATRIREATGQKVEVVPLSSLGDEDQIRPLARFLQPGAFTGRLDVALMEGEADLAVHSLKDIPLAPPAGLTRPFVLERVDPADRLVTAEHVDPRDLANRRVGTSAPRRQSQLQAHHPDAVAVDVRGSIGTRLGRVADDELDALFVAAAALLRGGDAIPENADVQRLPLVAWPTAPGQGALALQAKEGSAAHALLERLEDPQAARAVAAERGLLADLGGGCGTPLGATCLPPGHAEGDAARWTLHVTYPTTDGSRLRTFSLHDADPEACRGRAFTTLQQGTDGPDPTPPHQAGRVLLVMDPATSMQWRDRLHATGFATEAWWPFRTLDLLDGDEEAQRDVTDRYASSDWVLVTSARAVPAAARLHEATGALPRFAAVGPATARALRRTGLPVSLMPATVTGADLVRLLHRKVDDGDKVLWLCAADVTPATGQALDAADLKVERIPVYRVDPAPEAQPPDGPFDATLFTSTRTARTALPLLAQIELGRVFAMGPTAAAALAETLFDVTPLPHPTPTALLQMLQDR